MVKSAKIAGKMGQNRALETVVFHPPRMVFQVRF
jgi:hypothetical protein